MSPNKALQVTAHKQCAEPEHQRWRSEMNQYIRQIVDAHRQKYERSCSPSLIELLLKIHNLVPSDYYDLQDRYQNQNVGLIHFRDQVIQGLRIHCHDASKGQPFLSRLQELSSAGQIVALYCVTPNDPYRNCHGWIVEEIHSDRIHLLSKYSEGGNGEGKQTASLDLSTAGHEAIQITDLIYGCVV